MSLNKNWLDLTWDLYENTGHAMVCFFCTSVANETENLIKHLVETKTMGENTVTNIMKVSVAGTSFKESEKKVYES